MIIEQNLLGSILINKQLDFLEAIIPMMNSDLNREIYFSTLLRFACQFGHIKIVQALIGAGTDLDRANNNGFTPLHLACQFGHLGVFQALIGAGADLNKFTTTEVTPLHMACYFGHPEVAQALIGAGADLNKPSKNGLTPLLIACQNGHLDIAKALFEAGANVDCLKQKGYLYGYYNAIDEKLINNKSEEIINSIKKFIDPEEIKKRDERLKNINKPHSDTTSPSGETLGGMAGGRVPS